MMDVCGQTQMAHLDKNHQSKSAYEDHLTEPSWMHGGLLTPEQLANSDSDLGSFPPLCVYASDMLKAFCTVLSFQRGHCSMQSTARTIYLLVGLTCQGG